MSNHSLRERVLEQQAQELKMAFVQFRNLAMRNLATIVHYCGGTLTLREDDYKAAHGLLLTEEVDQVVKTITFRTRRVGCDGGDEQGGLLPPTAGTLRDVLTPEEEAAWKRQTIEGQGE